MPNHRRNGKKPRREFVKQSVATLGAGSTTTPEDEGAFAASEPEPQAQGVP